MEILIADGMSTDGTRAIVQEYQNRFDNIYLVEIPAKSFPQG
jgi:glycosyltransferase involved in cell wall biosynthesis